MDQLPPGAPSPNAQHSASASALGYLYQAQLALLELIQNSKSRPDSSISIELYDDVAWDTDGSPTELLQLKHRVTSTRSLSDSDEDVWRTLNSWLDSGSPFDPDGPVLTLMTTQVAADGSAMAALRAENRDIARALTLLSEAARRSSAAATQHMRSRFLDLSLDERELFISRIFVLDAAPAIESVEDLIRMELALSMPIGHESSFITQLVGWWYQRVIAMLKRHIRGVSALTLRVKLDDLRSQYREDNLPTYHDITGESEESDSYRQRTFIHQLHWISAPDTILRKAVLDYYMAYSHSTRWVEEDLIGIDELERFEERLQDEWERARAWLMNDLPANATDQQKEEAGRTLLRSLTDQAVVHLRERYNEPFFGRGKHHELADEGRIGWHPDFRERLEALLLSRTA